MGKFLTGFILALILAAAGVMYAKNKWVNIDNTVVTMDVAEGVEAQDVIDAMLSKATEVNMKYVGNIPLYKELRARNVESGHLEIFQFCNPTDARKMVDISPSFAAYLPCRIVLVEGKDKKLQVIMMDLGLVIKAAELDGDLLDIANKVNGQLHSIMEAGASGDF